MRNKIIIVISPEKWGDIFVSKHHYANYLSKGNNVFFLNPPSPFKLPNMLSFGIKTTKISEKLTVIDYSNPIPFLNKLPVFISNTIYRAISVKIKKHIAIKRKIDIVWSFDPYRFFNQKIWQAKKTIYHSVDFHYTNTEKEICQSSNLIIGISDLTSASIKSNGFAVHNIGHGADIDGFEIKENVNLPGTNKLKACYVGNFHNHLNYDLLLTLTSQNKNVDFILIGPTTNSSLSTNNHINKQNFEDLNKKNNVFFIGVVPYFKLMSYIAKCDVNLVFFDKQFNKIHCNPHKILGYIYSGNVTISSYIDHYKNTNPILIKIVDDNIKYPEVFQNAVENINKENSSDNKKQRLEYAKQHSYSNKIEEVFSLLYN